ncbi:MAG: nicotinate (nicotinamide) nucleotide adenylyltransferase [Candidatus Dormiibacterota bacterium]
MTSPALVVFGGTFDPPHLGHLAVIRGLRAGLGRPVLVVPNGRPAHRRAPTASPADRLRMATILVEGLGDPEVSVSDLEVTRSGPSYTADTLEQLRAADPGRPLILALGADAARGLPRWHRPERVQELAQLLVFDRPGARIGAGEVVAGLLPSRPTGKGPLVLALSAPRIEARHIRAELRRGADCEGLLPGPVLTYIRQRHLYRSPEGETAVADGIISSQ